VTSRNEFIVMIER